MVDSFDKISLIARQVQRDRLKAQAQAAESRFNHGLGLRQFTTPEPVSLAKTYADPTANTAVGNLTNPR